MKLFTDERHYFTDPTLAAADGLIAVSDEMPVEKLLEAYSFGIFPWPHEDLPVLWFSPEERGVLDFSELHISRSLRKLMQQNEYKITFNQSFSEVLKGCAASPRPGQRGTWITENMQKAYTRFFKAGYSHSIECWMDGALAGGLYGVFVGGVFSGESMFFNRDNASKLCLVHTIEALKKNGLTWMDIQMVTDHLRKMGGKYIAREEFLKRLIAAHQIAAPLVWP